VGSRRGRKEEVRKRLQESVPKTHGYPNDL